MYEVGEHWLLVSHGTFFLQGTFDKVWRHIPEDRGSPGIELVVARDAAKLPTVHLGATLGKELSYPMSVVLRVRACLRVSFFPDTDCCPAHPSSVPFICQFI